MRLITCLLWLCSTLSFCQASSNVEICKIIMILGELDKDTLNLVQYAPGVQQITLSAKYTLLDLKCSETVEEDTNKVQQLLSDHSYEYVCEDNKIAEYDIAYEHLDRLDQYDLPLDGVYNPPGDGSGVHIYILDSGVNIAHEDFEGRAVHDFHHPLATSEPCTFHGTWVASIAGGAKYGVAKKATIHDIKIGIDDFSCSFTLSAIVNGLLWILNNGAKPMVINTSWSIGGGSMCVDELVKALSDDNALFVTSAGNSDSASQPCTDSPSRAVDAVSVASVDRFDMRSSFSSYGVCVDYFAPGENVPGADWNIDNGETTASGTSASSPILAGVGAVIFDVYNYESVGDVKQKLDELSSKNVVSNPSGTINRLVNFNSAPSSLTSTNILIVIMLSLF